MPNPAEALLEAMEQSAHFVAFMTGTKQQFVDAGWSEPMAEQATLLMLHHGSNATQ